MPSHENLLIVVDQFEELFRFKQASTRGDSEDEAAAFVKLLLEATKQDEVPIYVVPTMRSDGVGTARRGCGISVLIMIFPMSIYLCWLKS